MAEDRDEPTGTQRPQHLVVVVVERGRRGAGKRPLLPEDRPVERLQLRPRLDAKLLDERATCVVVGGERFGLPARAVEREHQVRA